ncbi:glycosyltransferase [Algoriphagus kandeliae]|uniref:Glycosyltransferase n=1 Tax=Algoriphagus kandeliae TaxID=2562278 RepID=A0A4Y9QP73_9BACT|nr:glycosyltransferase family protein [Algoriphagus kandeliae]TFV94431.1 glycosyltransferase [Algoriphagus kandeliae]
MKFLFIVQGEGRGHMTQAISFASLLRSQGHELCGVVLGKSKRRAIPEFFSREIKSKIHWIESPNFETDRAEKRILLGKTIWKNSLKFRTFLKSLHQIDVLVNHHKPDVILNFYDLLGGLYNGIYRPNVEFWAIGHQYLAFQADFSFAPSKGFAKELFLLNTKMTAWGASRLLALSFKPTQAQNSKIEVVPPLLRKELQLLTPSSGEFYLAYLVNPGYSTEIIKFAKSNPSFHIKAYWDKKGAPEIEQPLPNLSFHQVNDKKFLNDMATCKGLVCTAGFESVCEAAYFGKPVMMIPVAGQYEQACNALDAEKHQIAIEGKNFDFSFFEKHIQGFHQNPAFFQLWCEEWPEILEKITQANPKTAVSSEFVGSDQNPLSFSPLS